MVQNLIDVVIGFMGCYLVTFFAIGNIAESGGHFWRKGRPYICRGKEKERFLVSLEDGSVVIAGYDSKEGKFSLPGVVAWRRLPSGCRSFRERYFLKERKDEKNRQGKD